MAYAHSPNDRGEWHDLVDHLRGTAALAEEFAKALGAPQIGRFLGLWHDLGKFHPAWQRYLQESAEGRITRGHGPDHKGAGAHLAERHLSALAMLIQGHHGGLQTPAAARSWLAKQRAQPALEEALRLARRALPDLEPIGPLPFPAHVEHDPHAAELFLRLLFAALVDADRLDTEQHATGWKTELRASTVTVQELWEKFERDQQRRFAGVSDSPVNRARREIYMACLAAAELPPGLFRLTVPTGAGKTRSAMAFALRHALCHGHRQVIVAVPFITITQQTAAVYREIFDDLTDERGIVLEHHSDAILDASDEGFTPRDVWNRLAAENWDAPIVVTTTVQLFESTFSNNTRKVRKVHRLARSVLIIDEVQSLPPHLLEPILDVIRDLCMNYGTTVVISTATQPAFEVISPFRSLEAREIVPQPGRYFAALKRVHYEWRLDRPMSWDEVARLMRDEQQVLAVVNTKRDAHALLDALADPDALHLSTLLCGMHRRRVVDAVRQRLAAGMPCRLISTQVIEAGVDVDFPLVLRALGPLDAIVQTAGRCNREGRHDHGRMIVFRPVDGGMPTGTYRTATETSAALLGGGGIDADDPIVLRAYFERLYELVSPDRDEIQRRRAELDYPSVAQKFRLIDDDTVSVAITSYGSETEQRTVRRLLDRLGQGAPDARHILRRLQPYTVAVRRRDADRLTRAGFIVPVVDGLGEWVGRYDPVRGLVVEDPDLVV